VKFLSSVSSLMTPKLLPFNKSLITFITFKRFCSCMNSLV
ncbi:hypothetical protein DBR06_SOUSAS11710040, partial [Sousa chinensis]